MSSPRPYEVLVRWGDQRLTTELLDANRPVLTVGDDEFADVVTGRPARLLFERHPKGVRVTFSEGVTGTFAKPGGWAVPLTAAIASGEAKETAGGWALDCGHNDVVLFSIGSLTIKGRPARLTPRRLPLDARWLWLLGLALFVIAVLVAAMVSPDPRPRRWLQQRSAPP